MLKEHFDLRRYNIHFAERVSVGELFILNQSMMKELYDNALVIINKLITSDYLLSIISSCLLPLSLPMKFKGAFGEEEINKCSRSVFALPSLTEG